MIHKKEEAVNIQASPKLTWSVILDVVQLSMKTYRTFKTVQIIFYLCQLLRQNFNYLCSEYIELTDSLISSLNHCVSVFCEIKIVLMLILIWIYMSCHSIPQSLFLSTATTD